MTGRHARKKDNRDERQRLRALDLSELETLVPALHREIAQLGNPIGVLKRRLRMITDELRFRKINREDLVISDHAVVRYLERTGRVDVDAVRDEILRIARSSKGHRRRCAQTGLTVAVDDNSKVVATVLTDKEMATLDPSVE